MKKDVFKISKDFVLSKLVESIYIDVIYKGYDLQLIVQYERHKGKIRAVNFGTTGITFKVTLPVGSRFQRL